MSRGKVMKIVTWHVFVVVAFAATCEPTVANARSVAGIDPNQCWSYHASIGGQVAVSLKPNKCFWREISYRTPEAYGDSLDLTFNGDGPWSYLEARQMLEVQPSVREPVGMVRDIR
jgi:hypothetical protein